MAARNRTVFYRRDASMIGLQVAASFRGPLNRRLEGKSACGRSTSCPRGREIRNQDRDQRSGTRGLTD